MWRKLRYAARFLQLFIKRYGLLLIVGVVLGGLGFWLFPRIIDKFPKFRATETIGIIGRYDQNNIPEVILNQVSLGLTQIDEQGKPYPGLAKSWQVSDQGKVWTFELDERLTWSDGQPINASDINYNFKDVEINALDDQHLQFKLKDPYSPFPSVLSSPALREDLTGLGPYKFARFKRVGNYFKSIKLAPMSKESLLPNLNYIFYGTEEAAKTAFKLGEVQKIIGLLDAQEFSDWHNVTINIEQHPYRYVAIFFNLHNPNFKEKSVRQSLAYAIKDKSGEFQRVLSPINEDSWVYNPHVKPYEYDLERAKNLLGDANNDQAEEWHIQLATVPSLLATAERIANDWQEFGVKTDARVINTLSEDFDALLVTQEIPRDPDQYVLWHSTQPTNLTHYQSPKVDKLLEDGRKELDEEARLEIYQDFQRYLVEDLPAIFLFHPVTYTISRN